MVYSITYRKIIYEMGENKEQIRWKPRRGQSYWTINARGVIKLEWSGNEYSEQMYRNNLVFQHEEQAVEFFNRVLEIAKIF